MKKILVLVLLLSILLTATSFAVIDLKIQGSIYSELSSRPGDLLKVGSRVKMFSELTRMGNSQVKVRIWGLNQKAGQLNRYDETSVMKLENLVDWVEVSLTGNILPNGPRATIAVGNVEVDYSPYIISLKDDRLSDYISSYLHHRGLCLREMEIAGFKVSSFVLWGFNAPLKNAIGGQISRQFGTTKLSGSIVDYRWRVDNVEQEVLQAFQNKASLNTELAWQQVQSVEIAQELGSFGQCSFLIAAQDENKFFRQADSIVQSKTLNVLREYSLNLPLQKDWALIIGYREIPFGFDPYFRDRTPEYDPATGHYLGYNPLDRYQGDKGLFAKVGGKKEHLDFSLSVQQLIGLQDLSLRSQVVELALTGQVCALNFDSFSLFRNKQQWLETGVGKSNLDNFNRIIFTKPLTFKSFSLTPGFEWRQQFLNYKGDKRGTTFLRYQSSNLLTMEVGVRHAFSKEITSGTYFGLIYRIPNGMIFNYAWSTINEVEDGKEHYDPDYRLIKPGNLMHLSVKIDF